MTEAIFRTVKISSRLAPASSAARMCRRVPSGLRFVQAAFSPTPISSMSFRERTPLVHGFVDIFSQAAAQLGSHSRSCWIALSQGPIGVFAVASVLMFSSSSFVRLADKEYRPPTHLEGGRTVNYDFMVA